MPASSHPRAATGARTPGVVILLLAALLLSACGGDDDSAGEPEPTAASSPGTEATPAPTADAATPVPPTATPPPAEPTSTPAVEPTVTTAPTSLAVADERVVSVYWLRDTRLAAGGRVVAMPELASGAIDALLEGPTELEKELGMVSTIPVGTELLGLTISDGVAAVDLSAEVEATGLGSSGEIGLVSQIVFTLTQFPAVDTVDIVIEGEARDAILSHGLEATNLTRDGLYDAVAPAIVVESPYPGERVTSPMSVRGFSRTFEGTVVYDVVVPPSGEIVDAGFTTAAQPDAQFFGPFEFTSVFEAPVAGVGAVIVFEESAQDGSPINVYEVPVLMEPDGS